MEDSKKSLPEDHFDQMAAIDDLKKDDEERVSKKIHSSQEEAKLRTLRERQFKLRLVVFMSVNLYLSITYIVFSISDSASLSAIWSDWTLIGASVFGYLSAAVILFGFPYQLRLPESFSDIDRQHQEARHVSGNNIKINVVTKHDVESLVDGKVSELTEQLTEAFTNAADNLTGAGESQRVFPSQFEQYLIKVTDELDYQITLSDKKASGLLDRGILFLGLGLFSFICSIFMWQYFFTELSPLVILGMVSCTVAFVVIEFLAAWFLKQYRGFVDTSLSYARVRSHYERCLLSYHAVKEFDGSDEVAQDSKNVLLQYLDREAKWPSSKQLNSNDFNYMLESMASFTAVLDKMKGLVKKAKPAPTNEKV